MRQILKNVHAKTKIPIYMVAIFMVAVGFFAVRWGILSEAAEGESDIWLTAGNEKIEGEFDLEKSSQNFMLESSGTQYYDDKYQIEWSIPVDEDKEIIEFQTKAGDPPEAAYQVMAPKLFSCVVRAKKPGTAELNVRVYDSTDPDQPTLAKQLTLTINVAFAIDTSMDDDYKLVFPTDEDKSLFLYTGEKKPMALNIGNNAGTDLYWSSSNKDVVTMEKDEQNISYVKAVGAGRATITVEGFGKSDSITVYVVPRTKMANSTEWSNTPVYNIHTGETLYTDTVFQENKSQTIRDKVAWAIYKYDTNGTNRVLIEDSMGTKKSDLIELTTFGADEPGNLKVTAKAGEYVIDFYAAGTYTEDGEIGNVGKRTSVKLNVCAEYGDREININTGDRFNLADALNITIDEFQQWFNVSIQDSSYTTYLSYNSNDEVIEGLKATEQKSIDVKISPKKEYVDTVDKLLGDGTSTTSVYTFRVVDQLFLSMSNVSIVVGEELQLAALTGNYEGELSWESSDPSLVTVSDTGVIKGIAKTTEDVTITVSQKMSDGSIKVATCKVKVEETIKDITLSKTEVEMLEGTVETIFATFDPDRNEAPLQWMSSDEDVFSINVSNDKKSVVITANKAGTAVLTALNEDNYVTAVCKVTVLAEMTSISFPSETMTVRLNQEMIRMQASCAPAAAVGNALDWASSDPSVATVDENGLVTLLSAGNTIITVKPVYNTTPPIMAQCILTVEQSATGFSIDENSIIVENGETKPVSYSVVPENALTSVSWVSLDPSIAEVSEDGQVTGKKAGSTFVIGTCEDGFSDSCLVTVTQVSTGIEFATESVIVENGASKKLEYSLTPEDATISVEWLSMDPSIAEVDSEGVVTGKKAGTTYVIVTSADGYSDTCEIIVTQSATGITLNNSEITIENGDSMAIEYLLDPVDATTGVEWSVMDSSIATVDDKGVVTGRKAGETYVIATSVDGYSASCKVNVTQKAVGLKLAMTDLTLGVGTSYTVGVTIDPEDATDRSVVWTSQNSEIATVDNSGKVTGVAVGTTTVIAKISNGEVVYLNVTVKDVLTALTLDVESVTVGVGKSVTIVPSFTPENAANTAVSWKSSDDAVATVDENGKVTGVAGGTAMITCTAEEGGYVANCIVTVIENVTEIKLNKTSLTLTVNKTAKLKATVNSNTVNNPKVKWTSSNKKIATVNQSGTVVAKKVGKCTIKASATDGSGVSATCSVRIIKRVGSLKISRAYMKMMEGTSKRLKAKVSPKKASIKRLKWSSSDTSIAVVSGNGKVTALTPGLIQITVKTTDGSKLKASCTVQIYEEAPVTSLTVSAADITMVRGTSQSASVSVSPIDTTDKITYSSDARSVATVSSKGKITARRPGTATITVSSSSGKQTYINVTVVGLNKTAISLEQYDSDDLWVEEISENVKWSSSNPAIARVNSSGQVIARKVGTCTVTATVRGVKLHCTVRVTRIRPH